MEREERIKGRYKAKGKMREYRMGGIKEVGNEEGYECGRVEEGKERK